MVHRRQLLLSFAGLGATLGQPWPIALAQSANPTMHIVLLAHGAGVSAETRAAAGAAFSARGLPFALSLGPGSPPGEDVGEPLVWSDEGIDTRAYFQSRLISAARAELVAARAYAAPPVLSLAAPDPGGALRLGGMRASGLRNIVLVPAETSPAWIESHPSQITVSRGGHVARAAEAEAAAAYLEAIAFGSGAVHAGLFVDLDGAAGAVQDLADMLAEIVAADVEAGRITPILPVELGPRRSFTFQRLIGLRLDPPRASQATEADRAALAALTQALDEARIGYSIARDNPDALGPGDCLRLDAGALDKTDALQALDCVAARGGSDAFARQLAERGVGAATGLAPAGFIGLDGNGLQHLGPEYRAAGWNDLDRINESLGFSEEPVIALDISGLSLPVHRNAALAALRRIAALPGTRIVDLERFARETLNPSSLFRTMRETRRAATRIAPVARPPLTQDARAALFKDARRAWRFFEVATRESSGLPAATVQFTPGGEPETRFEKLTQWDVGSAIQAHVAARKLDILSAEDFADWRALLLASLGAATLPAPRLPRDIFETADPARGGRDFNICDTARLLSALSALDRLSPGGDREVRALVAGWDLAGVLIDGLPHLLERGAMVENSNNHCTSYIARSFARWGLRAVSQYDAYYKGDTETDRRMHLLARIADIGPLGAEPLLMEALEFGLDAPNRYLRDVLFAAQIAETEKSGRLMAPSEGPMNREPWFSFQGLRVEFLGDARWGVMVPGGGPETRTEAFRISSRMLSTKAAFLWAAAHPHPYSDRLLGYARAHASQQVGFASGIYLDGDRPTEGYTDINTNGVILQAVARLLGR